MTVQDRPGRGKGKREEARKRRETSRALREAEQVEATKELEDAARKILRYLHPKTCDM